MKVEKIKPVDTSNYLSLLYEKNKQEKQQKKPKTEQKENFDSIFKECLKGYEKG